MLPFGRHGSNVVVSPPSAVLTPSWQWPRASPWARVSVILLLLSLAQLLTSIYVFIDRERKFFLAYLCYCAIACAFMTFRAKYGLLWLGGGSFLYTVWVAVLTYRAVTQRAYVETCLDFSLACFEFLIFCLALSRFHELGGCVLCCGQPYTGSKGAPRIGVHSPSSASTLQALGGQTAAADEEDGGEHEVYLSSNLLANAHTLNGSGNGGAGRGVAYPSSSSFSRDAAAAPYRPPFRAANGVGGSGGDGAGADERLSRSSSDLFPGDESDVSSASSSYTRTVGRGVLLGPGGGYAVHQPLQPHQAAPSDFHSSLSFSLASVPLQHGAVQRQQQEQRDELQRSNSQLHNFQ